MSSEAAKADDVPQTKAVTETISELFREPLINATQEPSKSPNKEERTSVTKEPRRIKHGIRRCLSMVTSPQENDWENSPFLATIETNSRLHEPVLASACKRIFLDLSGDENGSPMVFKRPDGINKTPVGVTNKRPRSLQVVDMNLANIAAGSGKNDNAPNRNNVEAEIHIMKAVQKSDQDPDLIGDFSKPYILPLVQGKHNDLKTISVETLADVINGKYNEKLSHTVVDCRYPYEYDAGHIKDAKNIYTKDEILNEFLSKNKPAEKCEKRQVLIFHCEFSSERAPGLCRFLRNKDREYNTLSYPNLHHPELYLLNGGYKAFFESFKGLCVPQNYLPMLSKDHKHHLRHFRSKSKSWNGESKWSSATSRQPEFKKF